MITPLSTPPRSRRSTPGKERPPPPHFLLLFRILTILIPLFATLLLITTIYLFHLHHAHHTTEDDSSNLGLHQDDNHHSPGGSALRHKMDLAHFLLQKYDKEQEDDGQKEAMGMGWKGGNEENFIKLVEDISHTSENEDANNVIKDDPKYHIGKKFTWQQLQQTLLDNNLLPAPIPESHTSRGFSGLPPDQTPALYGAQRGHITCPNTDPKVLDVMSSMLAFWNDPRGIRDRNAGLDDESHVFIPPPIIGDDASLYNNPNTIRPRRYLTFEPDTGGWNNIRMSLENVVSLAYISGRTLVLPPNQVVYLLHSRKDDTRKGRNYYDFFNLTDNKELLRRVPIITSEEFLKLEGGKDGIIPLTSYNSTYQKHLWESTKWCEERKKSDVYCEDLYDHYLKFGQLSPVSGEHPNVNCFIFDVDVFNHGEEYITKLSPEVLKRMEQFCKLQNGDKRIPFFYNKTMHEAPLWHFETMSDRYRLLVHFYSFMLFTDPKVGNYVKRFVRDFLRYHDEVFCAAGKIILALQYEDHLRNLAIGSDYGDKSSTSSASTVNYDSELVGGFSSLHIRRGDLQFKEVKFDSKTWYQNTKEIWRPNEILYIATDEMNRTFFEDFRKSHSGPLRYFNDYKHMAELDKIDPTLYGMIDTVVASRGTVFAGTWFSTFSGYIIRLRGYYGMSKFYSYYSWLEKKFFMHNWMDVWEGSLYAREYPVAWTGIDGDLFVDIDTEETGADVITNSLKSRAEMDKVKAEQTSKLIDTRYVGEIDIQNNNVAKDNNGYFSKMLNFIGRGERKDEPKPKNNSINDKGTTDENLARGVAGRPMKDTPALIGAKRGTVECDTNVDAMAYWNNPQGKRDEEFVTPFGLSGSDSKPKYLVFTPDKVTCLCIVSAYLIKTQTLCLTLDLVFYFYKQGGFNNVRMSFEIIFIIAAALDRILVLPPEQPMYLLRNDDLKKHRGLDGFFDMDGDDYKGRVKYMTMEQFLLREGGPDGQFPIPPVKMEGLLAASKVCDRKCELIHDYLVSHSTTANITATHHECLVFDKGMYETGVPDDPASAHEFCDTGKYSGKRKLVYVTKQFQQPQLLYIQGGKPPTRMLAHYYGYLHFTDSQIGNYYKRYIRDLLHLRHEIFCAAGKIVKFLEEEGNGEFSSLHIRRGDFQYKKMKISGEEWYVYSYLAALLLYYDYIACLMYLLFLLSLN